MAALTGLSSVKAAATRARAASTAARSSWSKTACGTLLLTRRLDALQPRTAALIEQALDQQLTARDELFGGTQVRDAFLEEPQCVLQLDVFALQLGDDALQPLNARAELQLDVRRLRRAHGAASSSSETRHGTVPSTTRRSNGAPGSKCARRRRIRPSRSSGTAKPRASDCSGDSASI